MIGIVRERLDAAGRAARVRARRLSADGGAGRGARRDDGRPRAADRASTSWCRRRSWCGGWRRGAICGECGINAALESDGDGVRQVRRRAGARAPTTARTIVRERLKVYHAADAAAGRVLPGAADVPVDRRRAAARRAWRRRSTRRSDAGDRRRRRRGSARCDRLPVGGGARADARGERAGGRGADGAGGAWWRRA